MSDENDFMLNEFKIEAAEMFELAEEGLLAIDRGDPFQENYNAIFRSFHSLKGAAGMFGLVPLQEHMHKLESLFEICKNKNGVNKEQVDYFLKGIDVAKSLLETGTGEFEHISEDQFMALASGSATPAAPPKAIPAAKVSTATKGKIVIIDDEEEIIEILSGILSCEGFEVSTFSNPVEMINNFTASKYELVLTDLSMPEISGLELLEKVREIDSEVPVVFISGYLTKEVIYDALEKGAFGFIEKPFSPNRVIETAVNALTRYRTAKLLNRSISFILYQFSDLDKYLETQGKDSMRIALKTELKQIMDLKKQLKFLK